MNHVELLETEDTFVITVEKKTADRFAVARAVHILEAENLDFSHIPFISDDEQADIVRSLESMSDEEKEIGMIHFIEI